MPQSFASSSGSYCACARFLLCPLGFTAHAFSKKTNKQTKNNPKNFPHYFIPPHNNPSYWAVCCPRRTESWFFLPAQGIKSFQQKMQLSPGESVDTTVY